MRNNKIFPRNKKNNITKVIISVLTVSPLTMFYKKKR